MYYHSDCGHVISEKEGSMLVADGGWKDYPRMHLGECSVCGRAYPYLKFFDESVSEPVQEIVYKLLELGWNEIYIPEYVQNPTVIKALSSETDEIEQALNHPHISRIYSDGTTVIHISL